MNRPIASVSLDLDNLWTYMKTHGDTGWADYPSYLDIVVPRTLDILKQRDWHITWFIVGKDAEEPKHHAVLKQITEQGHEVGNHSYHHEPWLHLYSEAEIEAELARTEAAIEQATGVRPTGFRGPGYSYSPTLLNVLSRRGYAYDASTFPTFLGPIARLYYLASAKNLSAEEREKRQKLFGRFGDGLRPLRPYMWRTETGPLLEIPVTTMPFFKVPIHLSYLLYLGGFSRTLAKLYWRTALTLCRMTGIELSLLLHPLDFLGSDDTDRLSFFPAMKRPAAGKLKLVGELFDMLESAYTVVPMRDHANAILARTTPPIMYAEQ